ncbi:hypothetical protein F5Y18DRAFT_240602 [Xylariaceae sp. FL1019]|nr:hypothetical protein F5Y18DRAFT_240602 [Xylariaceae sp. FL1019]
MAKLTNYIAYMNPATGSEEIGHLDLEENTIQPLTFTSGIPAKNLYQVIEAGSSEKLIPSFDHPFLVDKVKILPPISGRDVLAVGKNYMEHAREFNSSGYDSSDKVDRPCHPVIFTKRTTSIIAHGEEILLHEEFTQSADYEGEIGVILGKPAFRVKQEDAWDYVWGYTIVNDVTARERQRDHKQFFLGKSADSYCPMGPIAVPKEDLPNVLRVQTWVNGELRQDSTSAELIFSIPELISVMSSGQTLQPGDVLATGTPAGVGIGKNPPVFLKPADEVSISVTGLGTLTNRVAQAGASNPTLSRVSEASAFELTNPSRTTSIRSGMKMIDGKPVSIEKIGEGSNVITFLHGLGMSKEYWRPLISSLDFPSHVSLLLYDFEGHGLTPTHPLSLITIPSLTADLGAILEDSGASQVTIYAHDVGCLVAIKFAIDNPGRVKKLILLGPVTSPFLKAEGDEDIRSRLAAKQSEIRARGMQAVVDDAVSQLSGYSRGKNPLATTALRISVMSQDPEAYFKACQGLTVVTTPLEFGKITSETLIVTGREDTRSSPGDCEEYSRQIGNSQLVVLENVGHWHVFEDVEAVAEALRVFGGV